jgi:hypothetical protein
MKNNVPFFSKLPQFNPVNKLARASTLGKKFFPPQSKLAAPSGAPYNLSNFALSSTY